MVVCLEQGADLHMAQLMPLPLTALASVKSRLVLPFWYTEKGPLNGCVCVIDDFNYLYTSVFCCCCASNYLRPFYAVDFAVKKTENTEIPLFIWSNYC